MSSAMPPPYTESGALIIESARKHFGPADKNAPAVALDLDMTAKLMQYLRLLDEKKNAEVYSKEIDKGYSASEGAVDCGNGYQLHCSL